MNGMVINQSSIVSTSIDGTVQRIYGQTYAFAAVLTDVSRKFRYFVIEEVNGGVQIKFTNTNPEADAIRARGET